MAAPIYRDSRVKIFSQTNYKHDFGPFPFDRELFYDIALIVVRLPERANFRPKRTDFGPESVNFGPKRANCGPERGGLGSEGARLGPKRLGDICMDRLKGLSHWAARSRYHYLDNLIEII